MTARMKRIDVTDLPDALRLAEIVARTNQPHVLERRGQKIAVLSPIQSPSRPARGTKAVRKTANPNDWLLNLLGVAELSEPEDGPTDVSSNKHKYLKDFTITDATRFVLMDEHRIRYAFTFDDDFRQYGLAVL
jgi:hypothetical protein